MSAPDPALPMDIVREVGIVLARRALDNPWIDHLWSPHGVLFPAPDCAAGELLSEEGDVRPSEDSSKTRLVGRDEERTDRSYIIDSARKS